MRALTAGSEGQPAHLERWARWIGDVRQKFPGMTNTHEREVFDWLYGGGKNWEVEKRQFYAMMEKRLGDAFFDPNAPLGLSKLTKDELLAAQPNMGSVLEEINARRQQIQALRDAAKGKDVSAEATTELNREVDKLKAQIDELYLKAQDIEQDQGTLFSRGEAENPKYARLTEFVKEKRNIDVTDEALDAAAEHHKKLQDTIDAAFEEEAGAPIPNTHRLESYREAVRQAAGSKEFVDALLRYRIFSRSSKKAVNQKEWLSQVEALMGDEWAWQELRELSSVATEIGLKPSQLSDIVRAMTPRGEFPSVHDAKRAREVVQKLARSRQSITPERIQQLTDEVAGRELTLSELNVEGAASMPPGRRITKRGAYYSQTPKERARARGKSDAELQELGIRTADDAIAKDAENLQQLYRNPQKLDKDPHAADESEYDLVPQLAADVIDMDWPTGKTSVDNVLRALEKIFNPSKETRDWLRLNPVTRTLQGTRPWGLDLQERTGLNVMDVIDGMQKGTITRGRGLNSFSVKFDRIHALEATEFIGNRMVPRDMKAVPKGMTRAEFHTRQDFLKVDADDELRTYYFAKLLETTHGKQLERELIIDEMKQYVLNRHPKLDGDTIVKMAGEYRQLFDDLYTIANAVVSRSSKSCPRRPS